MKIPTTLLYTSSILSPNRLSLNGKLFEDSVEYVNQHRFHYGAMQVNLSGLPYVYKCPHNTYIDRVFLYADSVSGTYTVTSNDHNLTLSAESAVDVDTTIVRVAPSTGYIFTPTGTATNPYLIIHTRSDRWTPSTNEVSHNFSGFFPVDGERFTVSGLQAANTNLSTAAALSGSNRLAVVPLNISLTNFSSSHGTYVYRIPAVNTSIGSCKLTAVSISGQGSSGPVITTLLKNPAGSTQDTFTLTMSSSSETYTESGLSFLIESADSESQGDSTKDWTVEISSNSATVTSQLNVTLWFTNY
jgi:hypothetical protein